MENNEPIQQGLKMWPFNFDFNTRLSWGDFYEALTCFLPQKAQLGAETSGCDKLFPCENVSKSQLKKPETAAGNTKKKPISFKCPQSWIVATNVQRVS